MVGARIDSSMTVFLYRVNRLEHVVIRERKGVEKRQLSPIADNPEVSISTNV